MDPAEIINQMYEEGQKGVLVMWTVYEKPSDYPDTCVARRHDVGKGGKPLATSHIITGSLASLRTLFLSAGLTAIPRHQKDDPVIVEVWL